MKNPVALVPEWARVLREAWSMWAAYGAVAFQVLDQIQPSLVALLPQLHGHLPAHVLQTLSWLCVVLVPILRVVDQGIATAQARKEQP